MDSEPRTFSQFIGQEKIKRELYSMLVANDPGCVLLRGTHGNGKTTLARIYASSKGDFTYQDTPVILENLHNGANVHIIDEVHLCKTFESLYDQMGNKTFVFCTTERQDLPEPFVSRCVELTLEEYSDKELENIIAERAFREHIEIADSAIRLISSRCRGVPRVGIKLLRRIRNLSMVDNVSISTRYVAQTLSYLRIHDNGLTDEDLDYLKILNDTQKAVALNTVSAILNRSNVYIQDVVESFLLNKKLISITPRGRIITEEGIRYISTIKEG